MKGDKIMKSIVFKTACIIITISMVLMLCCCSIISPENCSNHIGKKECKLCGINYFDELASVIKSKATSTEDDSYSVEALTDTVECIIKYDSSKDTIYTYLTYKDGNQSVAIFLLTMKPTTGTTYGWALYTNDKIANGTFDAEDVTDIVFRPEVTQTEFTDEEFAALDFFYETSISFCADSLHSLLSNNENNLKIYDLGFKNYTPSV